MRMVAGAEPWSASGGDIGALLLHGFTGSPAAVRPLAEGLAEAGLAVELPRLPGHGTRWQDLQRTTWRDWAREALAALELLRARTSTRVVVGLSVGGALALHLAAVQPASVSGLVLVNPAVKATDPRLRVLSTLKRIVPTVAGVRNDIALPGADEKAYDRMPLKALHSLIGFQRDLDFGAVTAPLLLMTSRRDHVVGAEESALVLERVRSTSTEHVMLEHSFHVATLDHDAPVIQQRVIEFAESLARTVKSNE